MCSTHRAASLKAADRIEGYSLFVNLDDSHLRRYGYVRPDCHARPAEGVVALRCYWLV